MIKIHCKKISNNNQKQRIKNLFWKEGCFSFSSSLSRTFRLSLPPEVSGHGQNVDKFFFCFFCFCLGVACNPVSDKVLIFIRNPVCTFAMHTPNNILAFWACTKIIHSALLTAYRFFTHPYFQVFFYLIYLTTTSSGLRTMWSSLGTTLTLLLISFLFYLVSLSCL